MKADIYIAYDSAIPFPTKWYMYKNINSSITPNNNSDKKMEATQMFVNRRLNK